MPNAAKPALLLIVLLFLPCCSRQKTINVDELRSEFISAASFAAEAETFIEYVLENRATRAFAQGHVEYLADEVDRTAKELHRVTPDESTGPGLRECRTEVDVLAKELTAVRLGIDNPEVLAASKQRIEKIRRALTEANSSL